MNIKPLSYDSLRAVLQNMEANLRLKLVMRLPSIRILEKLVPLKIAKLDFINGGFVINQTTYKIGIYQKSRNGVTPHHILDKNKWNENRGDIDQFGFEDRSGRGTLLPGDVALQDEFLGHEFANDADEDDPDLGIVEGNIISYEQEIAYLQSLAPAENQEVIVTKEHRESDLYNEMKFYFHQRKYEKISPEQMKLPEVEAARRDYIEELTRNLEKNRHIVQPYYNRRHGLQSTFDNYIQLMINFKGKTVKVERVEYSFKLHIAEKSLCNFVFGNRNCFVYVGQLNLNHNNILRVPDGLKLKIRELALDGDVSLAYDRLNPIIDESSFPLDVCKLFYDPLIEQDFDHPMILNAKLLIMDDKERFTDTERQEQEETDWFAVILNLRNLVVHKAIGQSPFQNEEYVDLIKMWIENGREIGTVFSFEIIEEAEITELYQLFAQQFDSAVFENEGNITIPMNDFSKLDITYNVLPAEKRGSSQTYSLKFEVEPI